MAGIAALRKRLNALYRDYDFAGRAAHDPISFPRAFKNSPPDAEVAGFVASCLAYGRIGLFMPVLERIFSVMGRAPARFARGFHLTGPASFEGVAYRFQKPEDITALVHIIGETLRRHGSLEAAFMAHHKPGHEDIGAGLEGFARELRSVPLDEIYGKAGASDGLLQLLPSPGSGSACKRLCLYLRWMARDRDIDLGLWRGVRKDQLIVPLDTHIMRVSQQLGFTRKKSASWAAATEVTAALRQLDPEDPLKYDFALCHMGITGGRGGHCSRGK